MGTDLKKQVAKKIAEMYGGDAGMAQDEPHPDADSRPRLSSSRIRTLMRRDAED